ncbi:hypothetical protein PFAG_01866 [Plasmodium falciparum Santa Lucia]|uniref:Uncharacterized protein n=5 Tax=Plasmodium falciparum TaxID=5833 RepID=A0A024W9R0_PLAFA|nr:hypothetical protein PFFVO_01905 [Plasmodium falciparum Vietnam Oak-Knoll (FVO)]ETW37308.1 hypothetical protein PFTANZ_01999 [Plasmodium falciparum Tanzania (2000708)]ETW43670.1 hypothetical protein PFNF135_02032 [Plasmodium falciparum NF135/5.C10]ETW62312.1 hypothetical protein PFMC_01885 [Plasmodium falciparum CAMP/Malaysia]EUT87963.1 hypothetical protein PFAG_01866 [Plasmodium falciparum Santa Lucia]
MFEGCSRHMEYLLNRMCNCYISEENLYKSLSNIIENFVLIFYKEEIQKNLLVLLKDANIINNDGLNVLNVVVEKTNISSQIKLLKKVDIVKSINNDKSVRIIFTNFKKKYIRHNAYNCKYNKKICFK